MKASPEPGLPSEPSLDLVVVDGELIDPVSGRSGRYDVGVLGGRVHRVESRIPRSSAQKVIEASGCLILPGLVDLHTHVFWGGTYWGVDPGPVAWRTGTTTWVDAGSAGAYNAGSLRLVAEASPLRTRAFLNVSPMGLVAETGEGTDPGRCDPGLCAATVEGNRDLLIGVKCRLDRYAAGDNGIELLGRALGAAAVAGVPLMVHIGAGPPAIDDVLDRLRPGDIVTHCATGQSMSLLDASGKLRPSAHRAQQRGVLFDLGHGSGGFSFAVARALGRQGLWPDIISSDLHQRSLLGPAFDLPTCMAKLLAVGMPWGSVVRAATYVPARVAGLSDGSGGLAIGAPADLGVFRMEEGHFTLYDTYLLPLPVERLLVNVVTLVAGRELGPAPPARPAPWVEVTDRQLALLASGQARGRLPWAMTLDEQACFVKFPLEGPGPLPES